MANIEILSAEQTSSWHQQLLSIDCQDVYFSPEYALAFHAIEGGTSHLFLYEEGENRFLYPFRLRQLPLSETFEDFSIWCDITSDYGYGGPIISVGREIDRQEFIKQALNSFDTFCVEKRVVAEFCRFHPLYGNACDLQNEYHPIFCNQTVWVDLTLTEEECWRQLRKGYRYDIRKAERYGIEIETCRSPDCADGFYDLYTKTMQDVGARRYYFFEKGFFKNTLQLLARNSILFFGRYEGKIIAAALYIWGKDFLHYYFASMDRDYANIGANKILQYHAMMWGKGKGFKKLHLGGGVGGSDSDSLMHFKAGFSKLRADFYIAKRIHNQEIYRKLCARVGVDPESEPFFPAYRKT